MSHRWGIIEASIIKRNAIALIRPDAVSPESLLATKPVVQSPIRDPDPCYHYADFVCRHGTHVLLKSPMFELLFSLKTFAAAMLALYLSMVLGLDNPTWAMMCVYIIAQPFSGMALAKGVSRLLGTLFGAIACMVLLLALHTAPVLHMLALALWLACCLALSLLERSAYSYAFMLSGYTALFISLPYVDSPLSIFNVVLARVEEIGLGIVCYMAIDLLLFPRKSHGLYLSTLSRAQQLIASWQQAIASQPTEHHLELRQSLLQCLRQCDDLRQQALRDSHRLRGHEALLLELQCQLQQHFSLLVSSEERLCRLASPLPESLQRQLTQLASGTPLHCDSLAGEADSTTQRDDPHFNQDSLNELIPLLGRSCQQIAELMRYLDHVPTYKSRTLRFAYHQDPVQALLIGAVAAASVLVAASFWYFTGWSDGYVAVMITGVVCSLFASADNPLVPAKGFFIFNLLALPIAMLYLYGIFPLLSDFTSLVLALAPAYLLGGYLMAKPASAPIAIPLVLGTTVLLTISNNASTTPIALINMGVAQQIGMGLPLLMMGILRRIGREAASQRLVLALERQLIAAARGSAGSRSEFESRHQELMHGLILRAGSQSEPVTQACGASLRLGLALLHLGPLQASLLPHGRTALQQAREQIAEFLTLKPEARATAFAPLQVTLRRTLWYLTHPAGAASREIELRFAAVLQAFETYPDFFAPSSQPTLLPEVASHA